MPRNRERKHLWLVILEIWKARFRINILGRLRMLQESNHWKHESVWILYYLINQCSMRCYFSDETNTTIDETFIRRFCIYLFFIRLRSWVSSADACPLPVFVIDACLHACRCSGASYDLRRAWCLSVLFLFRHIFVSFTVRSPSSCSSRMTNPKEAVKAVHRSTMLCCDVFIVQVYTFTHTTLVQTPHLFSFFLRHFSSLFFASFWWY